MGTVTYPVCLVSIYPAVGGAAYRFEGDRDPNSDLLSVTTSETIKNPRGTFSIDLVQRPIVAPLQNNVKFPWHIVVAPQDLVVIEMKRAGSTVDQNGHGPGAFNTVMIGMVDRLMESRTVGSDGRLNFVSHITGSSFGKFLVTPYLHWFKYLIPLMALGVFSDANFIRDIVQNTSPADFVKLYLQGVDGKPGGNGGLADKIWDIVLNTPAGPKRPKDILQLNLNSRTAFVPIDIGQMNREGDLWTLLKDVSEAPWHELFLSYTDRDQSGGFGHDRVLPQLTMRKAVFWGGGLDIEVGGFVGEKWRPDGGASKKAMDERDPGRNLTAQDQGRGLGQFTFSHDDLLASASGDDPFMTQMSRGDTEILTAISARSQLFMRNAMVSDNTMPLGLNTTNFKLYGYHEFTAVSRLIPDGMADILTQAEDLTLDMIEFFQYNHFYWSGSKQFALRPDLRVGCEMVDETEARGALRAYVEGIQHQWAVGQTAKTTVTFSRGVYDKEDIPRQSWKLCRMAPVTEEGANANTGEAPMVSVANGKR